jgi:hypothetical protein
MGEGEDIHGDDGGSGEALGDVPLGSLKWLEK